MERSIREKIEQYLLNRMSEKEKNDFEKQIHSNENLARQVRQQKLIKEAITDQEVLAFRKKINAIKEKSSGQKKVIRLNRVWTMAAAVLLLILAGFWFLKPTQYTHQELYAAFYQSPEPEEVLPASFYAERDGAGNNETTTYKMNEEWKVARDLFDEKRYGEALQQMKEVVVDSVNFPSEYYFELGLLNMQNQQFYEAIDAFGQVERGQSNAKRWYMALCYLAVEDVENCLLQLETLVNNDNPWQEQAKALLKKLP